ncbi:MAG: phosphohydrolase, partial [Actinomycetia bacterium]|nr:phosphohydrolase [Actinomycetes bacterium]
NVLESFKMPFEEILNIMNALGNHEDEQELPTHPLTAALSIADKSDVHFSRVKEKPKREFDIHDRVNFAAKKSKLKIIKGKERIILLELEIKTENVRLMEYFEIFLSRMTLCRKSAEYLDCIFSLVINKTKLL